MDYLLLLMILIASTIPALAVVWLIVHLVTHTFPAIQVQHTRELEDQRKQYKVVIDEELRNILVNLDKLDIKADKQEARITEMMRRVEAVIERCEGVQRYRRAEGGGS